MVEISDERELGTSSMIGRTCPKGFVRGAPKSQRTGFVLSAGQLQEKERQQKLLGSQN